MTQRPIKTEADDAKAWRQAVIEMFPALRAFANSLCHNRANADDLVQETLLKAWLNRKTFEASTNLKALLFTTLRNTWFSTLRKHRREVGDEDGLHAAAVTYPENQLHTLELKELLNALNRLPPHYRDAVILVGADGLCYREAAAIAGLPLSTMKSRVIRGRRRLIALLDAA